MALSPRRPFGQSVEALLDPLTTEQARIVEVIAEPFIEQGYTWPFFDYIEGTLDLEGLDAWDVLHSFPVLGRWDYSAVHWVRGSGTKLGEQQEVALTVLGIHHSIALKAVEPPLVPTFFALLDYLAECRRSAPLAWRKVRDLDVGSDEVLGTLHDRGFPVDVLPPRLLYVLMEKEPPTYGGGSISEETNSWLKAVPRGIFEYEGIISIDDYLGRLVRLTAVPEPVTEPATPSPLSLVGALDYLDMVWRVAHKGARLFDIPSAERAAKLVFPAPTADEFYSRLSGLAEILNRVRVPRGKRARDHPLAGLEAHFLTLVDASSEARITHAIATLEGAIFIRDAGQHTEAGERAVGALNDFGIGYPPTMTWAEAWETVSARAVEALTDLREELAATTG